MRGIVDLYERQTKSMGRDITNRLRQQQSNTATHSATRDRFVEEQNNQFDQKDLMRGQAVIDRFQGKLSNQEFKKAFDSAGGYESFSGIEIKAR